VLFSGALSFGIVVIVSKHKKTVAQDKTIRALEKTLAESNAREALAIQRLDDKALENDRIQKESHIQFENLANKIMDQNTQKFETQSLKSLDHLLGPLATKLQDFEKRVESNYNNEAKERFALKEELHKMINANQQISSDAQNLTDALKGDIKLQGTWGEIQLERILENSGLIEGEEFTREAKGMGLKDEDGHTLRPDVIINLPDEKHIILDSKVSMRSYTDFANATDPDDKEFHLKEFCNLTKRHVDGLAARHYAHLNKLNSPDFVLMFCPLEPAFSALMHNQGDMFSYAWDKRIIIVSPTNMLATLRTIASIWKTEKQTKNALEIARKGGAIYDKFVGFITDMEKIGKSLEMAHREYSGAMSKLSEGRGNIVTGLEKLKELGAKAAKKIDSKYFEEDEKPAALESAMGSKQPEVEL
jgi:DNA recombination protein RmuC